VGGAVDGDGAAPQEPERLRGGEVEQRVPEVVRLRGPEQGSILRSSVSAEKFSERL
jgi:hypothetical protein